MNFGKLPWVRIGLFLGLVGYGYREFAKEPVVYRDIEISKVKSLDEGYVRLRGMPYPVSYERVSRDRAAISFVLRDDGNHVLCYSEGKIFGRNKYLEAKALIDYCVRDSSVKGIELEGKMKDGIFVFHLPNNLEDMVLR